MALLLPRSKNFMRWYSLGHARISLRCSFALILVVLLILDKTDLPFLKNRAHRYVPDEARAAMAQVIFTRLRSRPWTSQALLHDTGSRAHSHEPILVGWCSGSQGLFSPHKPFLPPQQVVHMTRSRFMETTERYYSSTLGAWSLIKT